MMPTTLQFDTPATAKARAKLRAEIAKEASLAAGPAEPIANAAEFRFWCRDKPKAWKLLETIIFRWTVAVGRIKGTPGYWAVYPLDQWAAWSKLARRTLQSAIAELEAEGLIERRRHRFGGSKVHPYIRPTRLALELAGKSGLVHRLGKAVGGTGGASGSATGGATGGATDHTYFSTVLPLQLNEGSSEALSDLANDQVQKQEQGGKTEEKKEEGWPATPTATSVAEVWQGAMAATFPDEPVKAFTAKEWGQLKSIAEICPDGSAHAVVAFVVANWGAFCERAMTQEGASGCPPRPHIGFTTKHLQSAVNLWLNRPAPAPSVKPKATKPTSKPAPLSDDDGAPPTLAEVMEAMQGV